MAENHQNDIDLATAAEQSSEEDENQEGNSLEGEVRSVDSAEHTALHVEDENDEPADFEELAESLDEAIDPEADAAVDDALAEQQASDAAIEAVEDEELVEEQLEAAEEPDVTPYDGPDINGPEDRPSVPVDSEGDPADIVEQELDEEAPEVDPYEEFKSELRAKPGKWYVIHSYAGFEKRVKQNIENRKVSMSMEDYVFEVQVPMEDVVEIKNGQRKLVNRVRIPGYVLVRMDLNEDSWSVIRHTPGVTGFVGNSHNPTPLRFDEAFTMLKSLVQVVEAPAAKGAAGGTAAKGGGRAVTRSIPAEVDFEIGETITIKEGSFAGLPGTINEIKPESGKLTVLVSLFERETPVELSFDQVTKL